MLRARRHPSSGAGSILAFGMFLWVASPRSDFSPNSPHSSVCAASLGPTGSSDLRCRLRLYPTSPHSGSPYCPVPPIPPIPSTLPYVSLTSFPRTVLHHSHLLLSSSSCLPAASVQRTWPGELLDAMDLASSKALHSSLVLPGRRSNSSCWHLKLHVNGLDSLGGPSPSALLFQDPS